MDLWSCDLHHVLVSKCARFSAIHLVLKGEDEAAAGSLHARQFIFQQLLSEKRGDSEPPRPARGKRTRPQRTMGSFQLITMHSSTASAQHTNVTTKVQGEQANLQLQLQ